MQIMLGIIIMIYMLGDERIDYVLYYSTYNVMYKQSNSQIRYVLHTVQKFSFEIGESESCLDVGEPLNAGC